MGSFYWINRLESIALLETKWRGTQLYFLFDQIFGREARKKRKDDFELLLLHSRH